MSSDPLLSGPRRGGGRNGSTNGKKNDNKRPRSSELEISKPKYSLEATEEHAAKRMQQMLTSNKSSSSKLDILSKSGSDRHMSLFKAPTSIGGSILEEDSNTDKFQSEITEEEDDDDRLYGSGMSKHAEHILNIVDSGMAETPTELNKLSSNSKQHTKPILPVAFRGKFEDDEDINDDKGIPNITNNDQGKAYARKLMQAIHKSLEKNTKMRTKYSHDPRKFMDSEVDLMMSVRDLLPLATEPNILLFLTSESDLLNVLITIISHEDIDVAIAGVDVLKDFCSFDGDKEEYSKDEEDPRKQFLRSFINDDVLEAFSVLLNRLDDEEEIGKREHSGDVHSISQIIDTKMNVLSILDSLILTLTEIDDYIAKNNNLIKWMVRRLDVLNYEFDQTFQYCAELLSTLFQRADKNVKRYSHGTVIDILVNIIHSFTVFSTRDPASGDEKEFFHELMNIFSILAWMPSLKEEMVKRGAIDILVEHILSGKLARLDAVKGLDHLLSGGESSKSCAETLMKVSIPGYDVLKLLISGKDVKMLKKRYAFDFEERLDTEHRLSIWCSLLKNITDPELRLTLVEMVVASTTQSSFHTLLSAHDRMYEEFYGSPSTDDTDEEDSVKQTLRAERYLSKLDQGLAALQSLDTILAFVSYEDGTGQSAKQIKETQGANGDRGQQIIRVLTKYLDELDVSDDQLSRYTWALGTESSILGSLIHVLTSYEG